MVYFLGRDVKVYIGTEAADATVQWQVSATGSDWIFTEATDTDYTMLASQRDDSLLAINRVEQLSGVDLSIGAMDEDTSYLGFRGVTKVEIKKETTISLTRKKQDASWDEWFNDGRFGVNQADPPDEFLSPGLEPFQEYGYRVWVSLKDSTDVFTLRNCCIQSHTVTSNVDGTSDETLELMSYVEPQIANVPLEAVTPTSAL